MKKEENKVINDLLYYNNLKIVQNKNYFNYSLDSVLLPNFCNVTQNTKKILDLCTGNAPIPIILSLKTKCKIIGIEIQKNIYDLANESVKMNHLEDQITILNENINEYCKHEESDVYDLITCNPPYFKYNKNSIINENEIKSIARHEINMELEDIFKISKKLLKNGGSLCMVHRTDRLIEIIDKMKRHNLEPKRIQFIYPKKESESNLVLIEGRKNGQTGLKILKPLIIHNDDGNYTKEVLEIFGKC